MKSRIYETEIEGKKGLVRASSRAQAFRYTANGKLKVEVATQEAIVALIGSGVKVEDANAEQVAAAVGGEAGTPTQPEKKKAAASKTPGELKKGGK